MESDPDDSLVGRAEFIKKAIRDATAHYFQNIEPYRFNIGGGVPVILTTRMIPKKDKEQ